eukprot:GEMP01011061.1.p1 GENE.GEMP01011061.1~~GEMP01011061.1.p1  ORF type:complete len:506 (+),score=70.35 GEMP01011061.1:389-1906(+)
MPCSCVGGNKGRRGPIKRISSQREQDDKLRSDDFGEHQIAKSELPRTSDKWNWVELEIPDEPTIPRFPGASQSDSVGSTAYNASISSSKSERQLSPLETCFQSFWQYHRYFKGFGNAVHEVTMYNKEIQEAMDSLLFGEAKTFLVHSSEERGCRFNPVEYDTTPVEPGNIRCELKVAAIEKKDLPKDTWSLFTSVGGNRLDVQLQSPSHEQLLHLFVKLFLDSHSLPIGTWVLDLFPHLSDLVLMKGTVTKMRRENDGLFEICIDTKWHPNLKERYPAVHGLIVRFELLEVKILTGDQRHVTNFELTPSGLTAVYLCNDAGFLASSETGNSEKSMDVIYFDPLEKIVFCYELRPHVKLKELGCGGFKLAPTFGSIEYNGSNICGGGNGAFTLVVRVTKIGRFPFEAMVRPFFDCDQLRQIVIKHFKYKVVNGMNEDGAWMLTSSLTIALPKLASALVGCLRSFARQQMKDLDMLKMVRDIFLFVGEDMETQCDGVQLKSPCDAPC